MSRNLGTTSCAICLGDHENVVLDERPRPITRDDAGRYFDEYDTKKLVVAKAHCVQCGALYLAWIESDRGKFWGRSPTSEQRFVDLSFQHSFNDEPAAEDLPTREKLHAIHVERCLLTAKRLRDDTAEQARLANEEAEEIERQAREDEPRWEVYRRL